MTHGQMDQKKIEARMKLRKLELEAYSSLINAFRAQGGFNKEKKRILLELRSYLSITIERHQAEIRRSINDDKLSKISSYLNGEDKLDGWIIEGRRVIPLLKRMTPKTGVSAIADKVAQFQVKQNQQEKLSMNNNSLESKYDHVINQEIGRKRLNSSELLNSKRKYLITSSNKSKNNQLKLISKTLISSSQTASANENATITTSINNNNQILDDTQPKRKLLIMSTTSSMVNNKSIKPLNHSLTQQQSLVSSNHQSIDSRIDLDEIKLSRTSNDLHTSDSVNQLVTTSSSNAKIYNPKVQTTCASSPKLMILPNNTNGNQQTKTLTIPISHNVKTLQLPAQNSAILYSTQQPIISSTAFNCATNTLKAMPGITIQAIKTQSGNKSNNFIIMPNKTSNNSTSTQAKGLLRQMNAKEFPLKIISTAAPPTKDQTSDKTDLINSVNQPTIILTNVSKETANSLAAGTNSSIGNLIKNQNLSSHPNIIKGIKVIPKCTATTNLTSNQNKLPTGKLGHNKTNPSNQKAITIPASFMEILKNIPISRIATPQSSNDSLKSSISITQNPNSSLTKTSVLKIPPDATTESITKLIFNNVISSGNQPAVTACPSKISNSIPFTLTTNRAETKKITLITKNSESPILENVTIESQQNDKEQNREMDVDQSGNEQINVPLNSLDDNESIIKNKQVIEELNSEKESIEKND